MLLSLKTQSPLAMASWITSSLLCILGAAAVFGPPVLYDREGLLPTGATA